MTTAAGTLYLCATPIGNLDDMTYRAVQILASVALVAAEDTRHTRKLLNHFDIHTTLISYHEHNKAERGPELIERLLRGDSIAMVSDAGLPGISDPGADLVKLAIAAGITVVPIPGANAALSALICSGLDTTRFTFIGFLPRTVKKRQELLAEIKYHRQTLIFYEAPHRVLDTLEEICQALGDRPAVAARELTKKFEEFVRGPLTSLKQHFREQAPRGEFTLVVAGYSGDEHLAAATEPVLPVEDAVAQLVATGMNKKDAIRKVASERGLARRDVYQAVVAREIQGEKK